MQSTRATFSLDIMRSLFRPFAVALLVAGCGLISSSAHALGFCKPRFLQFGMHYEDFRLPSNLTVAADTPDDTVIWESETRTSDMLCGTLFPQPLRFWTLGVDRDVLQGLKLELRYRGTRTDLATMTAVDTGGMTGFFASPFQVPFSIVLLKSGPLPPNRVSLQLINVDLFEFGGRLRPALFPWASVRARVNGTVNFEQPRTCIIHAGDVNQTVQLPSIRADRLEAVATAGRTNFSIRLHNCSPNARNARFNFAGDTVPENANYYLNQGTAKGVALHIGVQATGATVVPNALARDQVTIPISAGEGQLSLFGEYARISPKVEPGTLRSRATFIISYE